MIRIEDLKYKGKLGDDVKRSIQQELEFLQQTATRSKERADCYQKLVKYHQELLQFVDLQNKVVDLEDQYAKQIGIIAREDDLEKRVKARKTSVSISDEKQKIQKQMKKMERKYETIKEIKTGCSHLG